MLGREHELADVEAVVADDGTVVVTGEPGIGKTTLLRAAADRSGRLVRAGVGFLALQGLGHMPLRMALGPPPDSGDAVAIASRVEARVGDGVLLRDDLQC